MKNKIIFTAVCMQIVGCTAWKYPNWEYVRIESVKPVSGCTYKMQESCAEEANECPDWYKQRATKFNANTVVLINEKKPDNNAVQINNNIGWQVQQPASIADY
jgi:hypothetical protein